MITITFTAYQRSGVEILPHISVNGHIVYGGASYDALRGQTSVRTLDGLKHVFLPTYSLQTIDIPIKGVSASEGVALKNWLRDTLRYQERVLKINFSTPLDLGFGVISEVANLDFRGNSDKGVFERRAPGIYNIKLPLEKVR